jgi:hypothetical protein
MANRYCNQVVENNTCVLLTNYSGGWKSYGG